MGAITGKGLSELVRENYGFRFTFLLMCGLVLTNFCDVISEFAGVASGMQLFGISKYISVPIAAAVVWSLVVLGDYKKLEKVFVFLSFLYIAYIITAVLAKPDWLQAAREVVRVPSLGQLKNSEYLYLSVAIIGATIAPWQQFYLQASVVERGAGPKELKYGQADAIVGSLFSVLVAGFIVIACAATLFERVLSHQGRGRRSSIAEAAGGRVCLYSVFRRVAERFSVCRIHFAVVHRLHGLRSLGI